MQMKQIYLSNIFPTVKINQNENTGKEQSTNKTQT